jgi:hypothetical protein
MQRLIRRMSVRELLLCVTCFAIGNSHVITSFKLSRANAELGSLRQRLELIHVDNTNQIAARRLPSSDKHTRRWAIRIPNTVEKQLYANWGPSAISEIRDITSPTTHAFQLTTEPATQEALLALRVERNEVAPNRATLKIEVAGNTTIITIDAELASLLIGEKACSSEEIGDKAVTRAASSAITLFATETTGNSSVSFCLWLDDKPPPPDGR